MKLVPTSSVLVPALLVALSPLLASPASATPAEAAPFLAEASRLLVQGSYSDAARAFGEALGKSHHPYVARAELGCRIGSVQQTGRRMS